MAVPAINDVTFGIKVNDLDASTRWYARFLGNAPQSPDEDVVEFQLAPGAYLMLSAADGQAGVDASVNLQVDDIDEAKRAVEALGIEPQPIERIPDVVAYFEVTDPDGHTITLLQIVAEE